MIKIPLIWTEAGMRPRETAPLPLTPSSLEAPGERGKRRREGKEVDRLCSLEGFIWQGKNSAPSGSGDKGEPTG